MTPKTAEKYPSLAFVKILEKNIKKAKNYPVRKKFKFRINDKVRVLIRKKNIFRKDYQARFSYDIYTIYDYRRVLNQNLYYLHTRKGQFLKGSYREDELKLAKEDDYYPYTPITVRGNRTLVHWDGFDDSDDEWIDNRVLARLRQKK
jgi:hypothetical protein